MKKTKAKITEKTAEAILRHYFDGAPKAIERVHGGLANHVFDAAVEGKELIIRIAEDPARLPFFMKEQWAVKKARAKKVPVPVILEVGNELDGTPYMILEKVTGQSAVNHPERCRIVRELAALARTINSIPTSDFGHIFDWSRNRLSRNRTWSEYLSNELKVEEILHFYRTRKILTRSNYAKLRKLVEQMKRWKKTPSLSHGDIRLKNVILTDRGEIRALIDWENCTSNLAPYWELSLALHDLTIDERQAFLEGYGIPREEFEDALPHIRALNMLNYITAARRAAEEPGGEALGWVMARLNGSLDFFTLQAT